MALSEIKVIDKIEVTENGIVQIREATRIVKDGEVIAQTYHRSTIAPGQDYSDQDAKVKAICQVAHTSAVIEAYEAVIAENRARMGAV
jgi:hypothetical protein